jgi:pilus assembly protein Flp/PilA
MFEQHFKCDALIAPRVPRVELMEIRMFMFLKNLKPLTRDERGVTALEYGLIAGLMATVLVAAIKPLGAALTGVFASIAASLTP